MSGLLGRKVWRLQDVVRREGSDDVARVVKLSHPFRKQVITIIPVPRYAKESYYDDWVYQPYVKEHRMFVSNDIYNPFYVFLCRFLLKRNWRAGYAYFHPMGFPDCIDLNVTRRIFIKREQPFKTPMLAMMLTSVAMRDARHPWVASRTRRIVGDGYVVHPSADQQAMVMMLPCAYAPQALNTLQDLGFTVAETADAVIGESATLQQLNRWSAWGQRCVLAYLWFLIIMFCYGESRHVQEMFVEYKRDLVRRAGKDPAKMGL